MRGFCEAVYLLNSFVLLLNLKKFEFLRRPLWDKCAIIISSTTVLLTNSLALFL